MKLSTLVGERFKENPSETFITSHIFMLRGGYIKNVANGIYSLFMPLKRITQKIEKIIREEMDAIDGQEVFLPVILPASLWEESGRYQIVGRELLRFQDRGKNQLVLGMTHEEAAVHLVREYGKSYSNYPFMIYQIQTKFRDEARPRGGLIRVREFTMKDAYSFHTSQEDLEEYYQKCHKAYERIFARVGLPEVVSVASDSGVMGGNISHEFMLLTPIGEDSIATCSNCGYRSNVDAAESIIINDAVPECDQLTLIHTPNVCSIDDICAFMNIPDSKICKSVVYQKNESNEFIVVFIRGDLDVNETKLTNFLNEEIHPAEITVESGFVNGYIGPYNLNANCTVLYDNSLIGLKNIVCGANKEEYHYSGFNIERDCPTIEFHDFAKIKEGGICPQCHNSSISISRGIEVGNIFQLGDKYTKPMHMQYMDKQGSLKNPIMGCYGIGVGRLAAAVCEIHHDENGPIWPASIAPWHVHLCCIRADDDKTKSYADTLYQQLLDEHIEVLYDDRSVSAGIMFSDADLLGVPIRVIVSPRNLKENCCEIVSRDKSMQAKVAQEEVIQYIKNMLKDII